MFLHELGMSLVLPLINDGEENLTGLQSLVQHCITSVLGKPVTGVLTTVMLTNTASRCALCVKSAYGKRLQASQEQRQQSPSAMFRVQETGMQEHSTKSIHCLQKKTHLFCGVLKQITDVWLPNHNTKVTQ